MKLAVSGTREGSPDVVELLDGWVEIHGKPDLVIVGCARGVDSQARAWAKRRGYPLEVVVAEWEKYGRKKAGFLRNQAIVDRLDPGDHLVAFPGRGNGTYDCMQRAERRRGVVITGYPQD
jgi:hypothetical protein